MVNNIKKYLILYFLLLKLNFNVLLYHRATLVNNVVSSFLWGIFPLLTTFLLTTKSSSFFSWSRDELYILTGCFIFFMGLFYTLFGRSFKYFATIVDFGELDNLLVKPVDTQFLISFLKINYANVFRIFFGLFLIIVIMHKMHITWSISLLTMFITSTIAGIMLLYSIWFLVLTTTIWFTKLSNLRDLLITLSSITRYPPETFRSLYTLIFLFFLPFTLVVSTPAKTIFLKATFSNILELLFVSLLLFYISRIFWRFALRYYTSVSG